MKIKHVFIIIVPLLVFSGCINESAETVNSINAELTVNNLKTSEVNINTKSNGGSEVEIIVGENHVDVIGNGEELWFSFDATAGELYKISWQDSWWEEYTAGSIYVTGFEEDK